MVRKLSTLLAVAFAAGVWLAASAFAGGGARQTVLPETGQITKAMISAGRDVFHGKGNCFLCHGAELEGSPFAPTLRDHKWKDAKDGTLPEIHRVVTSGVNGTAMVSRPGGINDVQAVYVAVYVWSVSHGAAKP